jgi:hypothetical protein
MKLLHKSSTNQVSELEHLKDILFKDADLHTQIKQDKYGNCRIEAKICKVYGGPYDVHQNAIDQHQQPNAHPNYQPIPNQHKTSPNCHTSNLPSQQL